MIEGKIWRITPAVPMHKRFIMHKKYQCISLEGEDNTQFYSFIVKYIFLKSDLNGSCHMSLKRNSAHCKIQITQSQSCR